MDIREEQELRETMPEAQAIGPEQVRRLTEILQRYKAGKAATERRILSSEQWWKLRNSWEERDKSTMASPGFKSRRFGPITDSPKAPTRESLGKTWGFTGGPSVVSW